MINITNISREVIDITLNPFENCTIIEQHLDMIFYPMIILVFLLYIAFDLYYYKHIKRSEYDKMFTLQERNDISD